ncbi:putative metal-binding motif-containing protein [Thermodesulfobacteriota bacterium]
MKRFTGLVLIVGLLFLSHSADPFDCWDNDLDGYEDMVCGGEDCDDTDAAVNPCASEIPGNGFDEDCNGVDRDPIAGVIFEVEPNDFPETAFDFGELMVGEEKAVAGRLCDGEIEECCYYAYDDYDTYLFSVPDGPSPFLFDGAIETEEDAEVYIGLWDEAGQVLIHSKYVMHSRERIRTEIDPGTACMLVIARTHLSALQEEWIQSFDYLFTFRLWSVVDDDGDGFGAIDYCWGGAEDDLIPCGGDCVDSQEDLDGVGRAFLRKEAETLGIEDVDQYIEDNIAAFMAAHDPMEFTPCPDEAHRRHYVEGEGWVSPELDDRLDYNCSGALTPTNPPLIAPELDLTDTPLELDGDTVVARGSLSKAPDGEGNYGDFDVVVFDLDTPEELLAYDRTLRIHVEFCTDYWCPEELTCNDEEVMTQVYQVTGGNSYDIEAFEFVTGNAIDTYVLNLDTSDPETWWYMGVGQWFPDLENPAIPFEISISYYTSAVDEDDDGYYNIVSGGDDCDDQDPDVHPCNLEVCGNGIDEDCSGDDWACDETLIDEIEPNEIIYNGLLPAEFLDADGDGILDYMVLSCVFHAAPCILDPVPTDPVKLRGNVCQTGFSSDQSFLKNLDYYSINLADDPGEMPLVLKVTIEWSGDGQFGYRLLRGDGTLWFYDVVGESGLLESTRTVASWYDPDLGEHRTDFILAVGGAGGSPGEYSLEISAGPQSEDFCPDDDLDGFETVVCGGLDCDDGDPHVNPGAEEFCDGIDNACEGPAWVPEEGLDGDGYPSCDMINPDSDCYQVSDTCDCDDPDCFCGCDCNDGNNAVYPGAAEVCNGQDDNCDHVLPIPESDVDGDRYLECNLYGEPTEGIEGGGDCDDTNPNVHPGLEGADCMNKPDGIDNDCDGQVDEDECGCFIGMVM